MWLNNIYIRSELYFFKQYGPLCKIHSIQLKHFFPIQKGFRQRKIYFLNEWMNEKKRKKVPILPNNKEKMSSQKKSNFSTFCDYLIDLVLAFIFANPNSGILPSFLTITWKGWTQRTISVYWFATTLSTDVIQYWHCCLRQYCQHIRVNYVVEWPHYYAIYIHIY